MVTHACNLSTWEAEAGGWCESSLGYMEPDPVSDEQMKERKEERKGCHLYEIFSISSLNNLILLRILEVIQKYLNMVIYKGL